jgi:hypothetical protein
MLLFQGKMSSFAAAHHLNQYGSFKDLDIIIISTLTCS